MKAFKIVSSKIIPLPLRNIDTDMIIPAEFLKSTSNEGFGKNLFRRLRDADRDFPLNQERFKDRQILVCYENFGCGSSREHAVWALLETGIKVIIAPSFADIFSSNAGKNGLLLLALPIGIVDKLLKQVDKSVSVDLASQKVSFNGQEYTFLYDQFRKECFLKGVDDLEFLMSYEQEIRDHTQITLKKSLTDIYP